MSGGSQNSNFLLCNQRATPPQGREAPSAGEDLSKLSAEVFTSTDPLIVAETPFRPRTVDLTMTYAF
jgi:hypothetical protein